MRGARGPFKRHRFSGRRFRLLVERHAEIRPIWVDLANARAWRGHREVRLSPRAFDLLGLFVSNPDRLLTKDAILDALWPDRCVTEGVIKGYVRDLRRALGDDSRAPAYIRTVHCRGYRFVGRIVAEPGGRLRLCPPSAEAGPDAELSEPAEPAATEPAL